MAKELTYRIFVGERPWEELTEEEREAFREKCADRMGRALNDYYTQHPEAYQRI